jgi:hypothetical protein
MRGAPQHGLLRLIMRIRFRTSIETDLISKLEAIGGRLGRRVDHDRNAFDAVFCTALGEGRAGKLIAQLVQPVFTDFVRKLTGRDGGLWRE